MDSPSPIKSLRRDGPLSQLSPERVNGRSKHTYTASLSSPIRKKHDNDMAHTFFSPQLPHSPSLPEFSVIRERLGAYTDVSGLVKRFEHLDVRDRDAESLERKRKYDEALERASTAQEEAEQESRKHKEELRAQKKDYDECRDRERVACKRIDVLMDEFARAKEQWSSQTSVYEKEIRRARKEAFKSSSAVLKLQEESKSVVSELKGVRGKLDLAQRKAIKAEEEKFAAQYQLVAVQEELEKLQATLRIAQEEREAIKRSLKEDEIARIAAEGRIALPPSTEDDPTLIAEPADSDLLLIKASESERDLQHEKKRRRRVQELVEFMRLECQYKCCSCAVRASTARRSVRAVECQQSYDIEMSVPEQHIAEAVEGLPQSPDHEMYDQANDHDRYVDLDLQPGSPREATLHEIENNLSESTTQRPLLNEHTTPSLPNAPPRAITVQKVRTPSPEREQPQCESSMRMVTKTTKVPMIFSPEKTAAEAVTPVEAQDTSAKAYPFNREAALAAIAARRNRARSFAESQATPKRALLEGKTRRDISAPLISG